MVGASSNLQWLEALIGERFFRPCIVHEFAKKNEKNIFCLDCCISICPHCLPPHRTHHLLQVRRYVYHDVIRLSDAQTLMNCSLVQPYITNNAKVVFLNKRPILRPFRGSGKFCIKCNRSLQDPYLYCSLACKVHHLVTTKSGIKKQKYSGELLPLFDKTRNVSSTELDDGQMNPNSVLDSPVSLRTWSGSTSASGASGGGGAVSCRTLACTATTEFVKKKRTNISLPRVPCRWRCSPAVDVVVAMKRRKGVPHKAPLY